MNEKIAEKIETYKRDMEILSKRMKELRDFETQVRQEMELVSINLYRMDAAIKALESLGAEENDNGGNTSN